MHWLRYGGLYYIYHTFFASRPATHGRCPFELRHNARSDIHTKSLGKRVSPRLKNVPQEIVGNAKIHLPESPVASARATVK